MAEPATPPRKPLRWAHIVWALLAIGACVLLIAAGGGHPPPIVLLPVVVAVWVAGHGLLRIAQWLLRKGANRAAIAQSETRRWPAALILVAITASAAAVLGLLQLVVTLASGRSWPFQGMLWPATMVAWLAHAVCLAGLLLRLPWSHRLAALLPIAWAAAFAWEVGAPAVRGFFDPLQFALALVVAGVLVWFGVLILRSAAVRAFFGAR